MQANNTIMEPTVGSLSQQHGGPEQGHSCPSSHSQLFASHLFLERMEARREDRMLSHWGQSVLLL